MLKNLSLKDEGNLRFVYVEHLGYPLDGEKIDVEIAEYIRSVHLESRLWRMIFVHGNPEEIPVSEWRTEVGRTVVGLAVESEKYKIKDFSHLISATVEHKGTIEEIASVWRALADWASANGREIEPFWRIAFAQRKSAEGSIVPKTEISVFLKNGKSFPRIICRGF